MKRWMIGLLVLTVLCAVGPVRGADVPAGGMPAGHPDIGTIPTTRPAGMPAGHPDISALMGTSQPTGGMPTGHPDISTMPLPAPPTSRPTGPGYVGVHIVQQTAGGPAVGEVPVTVELLHHDQLIDSVETKTNASGVALVEGLSVKPPVTPRVIVLYRGVQYSADGEKELSTESTGEVVTVPVYETTDQAPAWSVELRHIGIRKDDEGLSITDVFQLRNPTDRTWEKFTMSVPIPEGVGSADYGGLPEGSVTMDGRNAVVSTPLVPGITSFYLAYAPEQTDGGRLVFKAPKRLAAMKLMVPQELKAQVQGLSRSPSAQGEQLGQDMYAGVDVPAGSEVVVTLAGAAGAGGGLTAPKIVAIIGGGLILIVGAAIMMMKGKKKA